jgi:hypothetical protein
MREVALVSIGNYSIDPIRTVQAVWGRALSLGGSISSQDGYCPAPSIATRYRTGQGEWGIHQGRKRHSRRRPREGVNVASLMRLPILGRIPA